MAKGNEAKNFILNKLQECFGEDFLGESNKKYYVLAPEDGNKIQIAITLTCPKTEAVNFTAVPTTSASTPARGKRATCAWDEDIVPQEIIELTQEEKDNIEKLKKEFNL